MQKKWKEAVDELIWNSKANRRRLRLKMARNWTKLKPKISHLKLSNIISIEEGVEYEIRDLICDEKSALIRFRRFPTDGKANFLLFDLHSFKEEFTFRVESLISVPKFNRMGMNSKALAVLSTFMSEWDPTIFTVVSIFNRKSGNLVQNIDLNVIERLYYLALTEKYLILLFQSNRLEIFCQNDDGKFEISQIVEKFIEYDILKVKFEFSTDRICIISNVKIETF